MPLVNIKMTPGASAEKKAELIEKVTRLMVDLLGKEPQRTQVIIEEIPAENFGLGGESAAAYLKRKKHG